MLKLTEIKKNYLSGENEVNALKGVSISFREKEFVSILGQSGCGKTTLLNIIGGLDHYTSGDLIINGISTKEYKDRDWDTYRNHTIGFVFQSYNLISHQSVLSNVELALTLSGVSKAERKKRATEALEKVGLGDQLNKKPNQLSGGQMQRVAIARALVNDPDIILADEPTGALDSETSVQVMNILKEISKDKLIIMVTHNAELADEYSTRIIRLLDGLVIGDSNPVTNEEEQGILATSSKESASFEKNTKEDKKVKKEVIEKADKKEKTSMSFKTALGLSINNLMTKKGRTILTAFAGSIGIIGIALIMSLSNGIQNYIDNFEEEAMSSYPLTIEKEVVDLSSTMNLMMNMGEDPGYEDKDVIHAKNVVGAALQSMVADSKTNNLSKFKEFLDNSEEVQENVNAIQYKYNVNPLIYSDSTTDAVKINPLNLMESMNSNSMMSAAYSSNVWVEMIDNQTLLDSQYEIVDGKWPEGDNECVLVVDEYNQIYDLTLYSLGFKDPDELTDLVISSMQNVGNSDFADTIDSEDMAYAYEDIVGTTFRLVLPTDLYQYNETTGLYEDKSEDIEYVQNVVNNSKQIKLVGIIRVKEDVVTPTMDPGTIAYTSDLTKSYIEAIQASDIAKAQVASPDTDVITGLPFKDDTTNELTDEKKIETVKAYAENLTTEGKASFYTSIYSMPDSDEVNAIIEEYKAKYTDRNSKIGFMIETTLSMMNQIKEGNIDEATMAQMGMDQESLAYMESMTEEDITAMLEQTYASLDDATVDAMFDETLAQAISYAYSTDTSQLNSYSNEELAAMLDSYITTLTDEELVHIYDTNSQMFYSDSTYDLNIAKFNLAYLEDPTYIMIYVKSFESKDKLKELIDDYNASVDEKDQITYTDYVALMMKSISNTINIISYVLIAFVSISLVVSSIMIGIITYISVLERTKEIGILRAIGASKKDIRRVFNSEAISVGFISGMIGILITIILNIPISLIIKNLTDVGGIAKLPVVGGIALVLISMFLTFIAGLIPSKVAAKKDPVIALRSE